MGLDVSLYEVAKCQHCGEDIISNYCLYDANITHNLGKMADKAGIYEALWRPYRLKGFKNTTNYEAECEFERKTIVYANDIIPILKKGLIKLKANPSHFKKFNSPNGWGTYKNFVPFVEEYLKACEDNPNSIVRTDR
jgi:hypothetical protein